MSKVMGPQSLLKKTTNQDASTSLAVPTAARNVVSWRTDGIKHTKNEIFLDVIEKLNILVSNNGNVLSWCDAQTSACNCLVFPGIARVV